MTDLLANPEAWIALLTLIGLEIILGIDNNNINEDTTQQGHVSVFICFYMFYIGFYIGFYRFL